MKKNKKININLSLANKLTRFAKWRVKRQGVVSAWKT